MEINYRIIRVSSSFVFAIIFFYISITYANSCCNIGSALISVGHPSLLNGTLLIQSGAGYSRAYDRDRISKGIPLSIAYGINGKISISVKTGYSWLNTSLFRSGRFDTVNNVIDTLVRDTTFHFENHGMNDGTIEMQYTLIPLNLMTKQELKTGVNLQIPWAASGKKTVLEGKVVTMPEDAQTGSGSYAVGGYIAYNRTLPAGKIAGSVALAGRIPFKNGNGEKPGNEASTVITAIAGPFWKVKGLMSVGYKITGAMTDSKGVAVATTGGSSVDLIPALECVFTENIRFSLDASVPWVRDNIRKKNGNDFETQVNILLFIPGFLSRNNVTME